MLGSPARVLNNSHDIIGHENSVDLGVLLLEHAACTVSTSLIVCELK